MLSLMNKIGDRVLDAFVFCVAWCVTAWCRVFGHRVLPLSLTMQERFPITIVVARCHRCEGQVEAGGTVNLLPPGPPASTEQFMAHMRERMYGSRTRVTRSARH